jgi:hypothetical protein
MGWRDKTRTMVLENPAYDIDVDYAGNQATITFIDIRDPGKTNRKLILKANEYELLGVAEALGEMLQNKKKHLDYLVSQAQRAVDP